MLTKILAKAVIFDENDRVLILRRSKSDDRRPGEPDFPGGEVEVGEDVAAGVSREVSEEAGLTIEPSAFTLFYAHTDAYQTESVTRLVYWARVNNPQVRLSFEHDTFHWATIEDTLIEFPHPVYGVGLAFGLEHKLFVWPA